MAQSIMRETAAARKARRRAIERHDKKQRQKQEGW